MDPAIARQDASPFVFEDGLGTRHYTQDAGNQPLEILTLRPELTAVPSFEFALRERTSRLNTFRHAAYAHVRGIDKSGSTLAVVSDRLEGIRLSELLAVAEQQLLPVEIDAGLCIIRQLVQGVAVLHEQMPDVCHGALGLERVIVTPNARTHIVEHVLGAALGQLLYSRERYWKDLRIAMPPRAGSPRFDRRADVTQLGAMSLALILGRPLGADEYPARIAEIVERVGAVSASGGLEPLHEGIRSWLARALQLDPRNSFASAVEARTELDAVLDEAGHTAAPSALENLLAQYDACVGAEAPVAATAPPVAAPAPAQTPVAPPMGAPHKAAASNPIATVPPAAVEPAKAAATPVVRPSTGSSPNLTLPSVEEHVDVAMHNDVDDSHEELTVSAMPSRSGSRGKLIAAAVALVVVASAGLVAWQFLGTASAATTGTLVVNTTPSGAAIVIDGKARGTTPLTASLAPGDHLLEVVISDTERRKIPVTITAGGQVAQFIELPRVGPSMGKLMVRSEPSGAKVSVDGHISGRAPVTIDGLSAGEHVVTLENELGKVQETVTIEPGATASLVVPMSAPQGAPVSGWLAVNAPADLQIFQDGRLLGTSKSDRIMMPVGRHDLEFVSEVLGYRVKQTVQVAPGQVATVRPEWPKGALAINALPWADVFIDGKLVGETPIGNIALPIGSHEVVFRHPELGEHRVNTIVTLSAPARVSVDLRKQ
jgi:hypothetical protein